MSVGQMSVGQMSVGEMSVGQMSVVQMSVGQMESRLLALPSNIRLPRTNTLKYLTHSLFMREKVL